MKKRGTAFCAQLPPALHRAAKVAAEQHKLRVGGQTNVNRILVLALYQHLLSHLSAADRAETDRFIELL